MNIAQLLSKLPLIPQVAVVVALLPENASPQPLGEGQFQVVDSVCQKAAGLGFADQQVHVFGHDHVCVDRKAEAAAHLVQNLEE